MTEGCVYQDIIELQNVKAVQVAKRTNSMMATVKAGKGA